MSREERDHLRRLITINRAHLRELEPQAAKFGDLHVPSHLSLQITEYRRKLVEQEEQLATMMPLHNLPPRDYERFVGRQSELGEVRRLLGPRSRAFVVTIDGIGGIGKSALALEAAYNLCEGYSNLLEAERFEAIVWVSAKRSYLTADGIIERRQAFRTLSDVYAAIAQVLDFPAITRARAEEQRAIVEQVLGEQRTLLILDNLETVDDEDLMIFLRELPDPTKALVTTRHRIDVAHPVRLTGMAHQDALALIDQEAARKEVAATADEREQLWQRTGGVPLAIVWSLGLMGLGGSVESVLRRLGSGQSDIAQFCFAESVAQVRGRDAYWLLLALSLFANDASREALGVVAGLGEDEFGRDTGLEELIRLSVMNKSRGRFSLLPLTRGFVQALLAQQAVFADAADQRLFDYLHKLADSLGGWSKDWAGQDLVEQELPTILAVIDRFEKRIQYVRSPDELVMIAPASQELARTLLHFITLVNQTCRLRGFWNENDRLCALRLEISRGLSDQEEIGWSYYELSKLNYVRRDLELLHRWATAAQNAGQSTGIQLLALLASRQLGEAFLMTDEIAEAARILPATLEACRQSGLDWLPRHLYGSMGLLADKQGDIEAAAHWYQQAIEAFSYGNNSANQAYYYWLLGDLKHRIELLDEARDLFHYGLSLARTSGRAEVIGHTLHSLAALEAQRGSQQEATVLARSAYQQFRRLGMKREQAEAEELLRQLGEQLP